jgi:hypothetical protein
MTWKPTGNPSLGLPATNPAAPDPAATVPVGTLAQFYEDVLGTTGEFIYLPGVAALTAGDLVSYDLTPGAQATTRHLNNANSNKGYPVAVAIAPVLAGQFGWFQIGGVATVNATAASAAGACFATATAGSVNSAADAGDQILNARLLTAVGTPSAGKAYVMLNRPCIQSQIT